MSEQPGREPTALSGERDRCLNCNQPVRRINYATGERWMHVDPTASFPTERKGTAWRHCRLFVPAPASEGTVAQ